MTEQHQTPSAPERGDGAPGDPLADALAAIEAQLELVTPKPERIDEACATVGGALASGSDPARETSCHARLIALLARGHSPATGNVFAFLEGETARVGDPRSLVDGLLSAQRPELRDRAVVLAAALAASGRLPVTLALITKLAVAMSLDATAEMAPGTWAAATRLVSLLAPAELPGPGREPVESLLLHGPTVNVRRLAARILDARDGCAPPDRCERLLGVEAARFLLPLLEYTRATHADLVDLTPVPGQPPPALPSLRLAADTMGTLPLGRAVGELGWSAVAWGVSAELRIALRVDGSHPIVVMPDEAPLIEACGGTRVWERYVVLAHGGAPSGGESNAGEEEAVQRFRRYNLAHAEVLADILEISPLDTGRALRIVERMDRIVRDFLDLFADPGEEATRLARRYQEMRDRALGPMAQSGCDDGRPVPDEVVRLVQTFEDPSSLDDVHTLHGLKRYLHQQGLRRAFGRFRSARATNRSVDIVIASAEKVLRVERRIRYLDFEPEPGQGTELPFAVSVAAQAIGLQLLHGLRVVPGIEILIYGNEVQVFVSFRNHPAFARIDLSPPLRGGMIDLEYFGVSQYEYDSHPDITLQGIQRIFRRLGFDVQEESFRLHVRYDKERTFEFGDLIAKTRELFYLVPHLMDVDWVIGGLEIPAEARAVVADAWGDLLQSWGMLPLEEILMPDRRHIRSERRRGPAGEIELAWDGHGEYRDCLSGAPGPELWERLRAVLDARGLGSVPRWGKATGRPPAQLPLERAVLEPLRAARRRGEVVSTPGGLRPAPGTLYRRDHEAERFARLLSDAGPQVVDAAQVAIVVASIDRQVRYWTTGSVQGHAVERAILSLPGREIGLYVLRDASGVVCLALAGPAPVLYRTRPDPEAPWRDVSVLDAAELTQQLRRASYLLGGLEPSITISPADVAARCARLRAPDPFAPPAVLPGDRIVSGISASPGRAAGRVCLGTEGRSRSMLPAAVLVAPAIRPKDTPCIREVAAIVTTGGGVLSHAGLIALEQQKPALIVDGTWREGSDRSQVLVCRRPQFREERLSVRGLDVVRRTGFVEVEETLREGDLVVVDADMGSLAVLGQDRDALALHHELRQIQTVADSLVRDEDERGILVLRGRLLRAVHQLQKLLGRIERATLARYAVRELLETRRAPAVIARRDARQALLETLFTNPACGAAAREAASFQQRELVRRHAALRSEAGRSIPSSTRLFEILMLRLGVHRVRRVLEEISSLLGARPGGVAAGGVGTDGAGVAETDADIDDLTRTRLRALCAELDPLTGAGDEALSPAIPPGGNGDALWRLRNRIRRRARLEELLGCERTSASLSRELDERTSAVVRARASRRLIVPADGGVELVPLVGAKAARLGELVRAVGADHVPPWFVVSDRAFRDALEAPPAAVAGDLGIDCDLCPTLSAAIDAILARTDVPAENQSSAIRRLWLAHRFPADFEDEILRAYRSLAGDGERGPGGASGDPFVAIRSSAFEEDTEVTSWAGQFDTFLFVRGEDALLEHLKLAMAGLWTPRAIDYRRSFGTGSARIGGGVIVQRMVRSRVSGVLHTTCLAGGQLRDMVINVGLGLGEGVVSGTVDVDHVLVSKERRAPGEPLHFRYRVGEKRERVVFDERAGFGTRREEPLSHQRLRPALEYVELKELAGLAIQLEDTYGEPLDIEFAYEGGSLFVLQLRPVPVFHVALRESMERHPLPVET